ncbi:mitotic spindle assembly checkpoint protein MAD2B-like [Amphiura filiformis]|uniref:mitotic spindle assembly checkpoint protein MAD2B-like n=1 Tax=Amphiura filiformis TaxID=82378 RepID=UPI003B225E2D
MTSYERKDTLKSCQAAADILCEFLEVAIHQILYTRQIYPSGIFESRKKYNVPVQLSRHPDVNQYITDVLQGIKPLIIKQEVQCLTVVILSPDRKPIERYVFELAPPTEPPAEDDSYLMILEQSLRAFLLRINTCDSLLQEIPQDCSFNVLVYTKASATLDMEDSQFVQGFPWIEADTELSSLPDAKMIPLKTMSSHIIKMQLYVEETSDKS